MHNNQRDRLGNPSLHVFWSVYHKKGKPLQFSIWFSLGGIKGTLYSVYLIIIFSNYKVCFCYSLK